MAACRRTRGETVTSVVDVATIPRPTSNLESEDGLGAGWAGVQADRAFRREDPS